MTAAADDAERAAFDAGGDWAKRTAGESVHGGLAVDAGKVAYPEDFEAFTAPILTFRGAVELRRLRKDGLLLGLKGGSSLLINTSGNPNQE